MAKRGGSKHTVRLTLSRRVPVTGRKRIYWVSTQRPGPHAKTHSLPLGVLLRDVLAVTSDAAEAKRILNTKQVKVDGKVVTDIRRPIGIMDLIEIPAAKKVWRMQVIDGRLAPKVITASEAKNKFCKVTGKKTVPGGKIAITLHDGRNLIADNKVKVGATLKLSVPEFKLAGLLPMAPGVRCLVTDGKHAGEIATLEKVVERTGSMDPEAQMKSGTESFVTVMKYLFVVDNEFA